MEDKPWHISKKIQDFFKGELKPKMESALCQVWLRGHSNCEGCPSSKYCREWLKRMYQYIFYKLKVEGKLTCKPPKFLEEDEPD